MFRRLLLLILLPLFIPVVPVAAQQAQPAAPLSRTFTLAELGRTEIALQLPRDRERFEFVLPATWQMLPSSRIELKAQVVVPDISVVVVLDGKLLQSLRPQQTGVLPLRVDLPPDLLDAGDRRHFIEVRISKPIGCDEPYPVALTIDPTSQLTIDYAQQPAPNDLSLFPFPLVQGSFEPDNVTIVLPNKPSVAEVQNAVAFGAKLGARSGGRAQIRTTTVGDLSADARKGGHLVLIGAPARNPLIGELTMPIALSQTAGKWIFSSKDFSVAPDDGILQIVTSPWNSLYNVLVLSGLNDAAVEKAVRTIGVTTALPIEGPAVAISAFRPREELPYSDEVRTLAELGYADRTITGIDRERATYRFYLPPDWQLTRNAALELRLLSAETRDTIANVLNVQVNEQPLFSGNLDTLEIVSDTLRIPLRGNLVRPGDNILSIQTLAQATDQCIDRDALATWTTIFSDTTLRLEHTTRVANTDLSSFPAPYSSSPQLGETLFVLSTAPTTAEISGVVQLAAAWGIEEGGLNFWPSVRFGEVAESELAQYNVVAVGRPSANPLIGKVNANLPQPFMEGTDLPDQGQSLVELRSPKQVHLGWIQELPAPWLLKRPLLVVTGSSDQGVTQALAGAVRSRDVRNAGSALIRVQNQGTALRLIGVESPIAETNAATAAAANAPTPAPAPTAQALVTSVQAAETEVDDTSRQLSNATLGFTVTGLLIAVLAGSVAFSYFRRRTADSSQ